MNVIGGDWPAMMDTALASTYTGQSVDTIKRAVRATDPKAFPPPLRAKRKGTHERAALGFRRADLDAWLASFPDA